MNNKRKLGVSATQGPIPDDRYLSVRSVSEKYDIKEDTIRKWIANHDIPSFNIRGLVRIKMSDIESLKSKKPSKEEAARKILKII
jgi:excisionase family DNA binding protein